MNAQQKRAGDKKMGPKRGKSAFPIRRSLRLRHTQGRNPTGKETKSLYPF